MAGPRASLPLAGFLLCLIMPTTTVLGKEGFDGLAEGSGKFALKLYKGLSENGAGENIVVSPISLQLALGVVYAGARGNTAKQLQQALELSDNRQLVLSDHHKVLQALREEKALSVATSLFLDTNFNVKQEFSQEVTKYFFSAFEKVDFHSAPDVARERINKFVEDHTNKIIKNLLQPGTVSTNTQLIVVNAIHFKANWKHQFLASHTVEDDFHLSPQKSVKVNMMHQNGINLGYLAHPGLDAKILEMPYEGDAFRMVVILPNQIDGLLAVEQKISTMNLTELFSQLKGTSVDIAIPKFKIEATMNLNERLQQAGAKDLFGPGANLTGLSDQPLFVSEVIQKAFIEVDEKGTEAAAATAVAIETLSIVAPIQSEKFEADHPFFYILEHIPTKSVLFSGSYRLPKTA